MIRRDQGFVTTKNWVVATLARAWDRCDRQLESHGLATVATGNLSRDRTVGWPFLADPTARKGHPTIRVLLLDDSIRKNKVSCITVYNLRKARYLRSEF